MRGPSSLAAIAAVAATASGAIIPLQSERAAAAREASPTNPIASLNDMLVPPWLASIEESYVYRRVGEEWC